MLLVKLLHVTVRVTVYVTVHVPRHTLLYANSSCPRRETNNTQELRNNQKTKNVGACSRHYVCRTVLGRARSLTSRSGYPRTCNRRVRTGEPKLYHHTLPEAHRYRDELCSQAGLIANSKQPSLLPPTHLYLFENPQNSVYVMGFLS